MVARQQLENAFENSALRPSAEALWTIFQSPKRQEDHAMECGSIPVQKRLDEQPIIRRRATDMAFAAGRNP